MVEAKQVHHIIAGLRDLETLLAHPADLRARAHVELVEQFNRLRIETIMVGDTNLSLRIVPVSPFDSSQTNSHGYTAVIRENLLLRVRDLRNRIESLCTSEQPPAREPVASGQLNGRNVVVNNIHGVHTLQQTSTIASESATVQNNQSLFVDVDDVTKRLVNAWRASQSNFDIDQDVKQDILNEIGVLKVQGIRGRSADGNVVLGACRRIKTAVNAAGTKAAGTLFGITVEQAIAYLVARGFSAIGMG